MTDSPFFDLTVPSSGPQNQTITFDPVPQQTYGLPGPTLNAYATSNLPVTFSSNSTSYCTVSGNSVTLLAAGDCTIAANQNGNSSYNPAPTVTRTFTILKGNQTIYFAPPATGAKGSLLGLAPTATSNLTVVLSSGNTTICTVSGQTVTLKEIGTCTLTASQSGNSNYNPAASVTGTIEVKGQAQTINFAGLSPKTYGNPPFTVAATATSQLTVTFSSDTPSNCSVSGSSVSLLRAGDCTIRASQGGDSTWAPATPVTQTFSIAKSAQTINFSQPSPAAMGTTPTLVANATSNLQVAFSSATPAICSVSGSNVVPQGVGTCTINANQAGDTNYLAAPLVQRSFTIERGSQAITFSALGNKTLGSAPFTVSAVATSNLVVTFSSDTPSYCTTSGTNGSTITLVAVGRCTLRASQGGNSNFYAAPSVTQAFDIAGQSQAITFNALTDRTFGAAPFTVSATSTSQLSVSFSSLSPAVCTTGGTNGTTVTMVAGGVCTIAADQAGNATYGAAPQVARSFNVLPTSQTITFNTVPDQTRWVPGPTLSATASSQLPVAYESSTSAVCTVSGNTVSVVGLGTCTIVASQAGNASYTAAPQVSRSFSVQSNNATIGVPVVVSKMKPGQTYPVSVTVTNTGNSTWTSSGTYAHRLGSQNPENNTAWGLSRVQLPSSVAPGASVTFNFNVTAPATPGIYNFQWQMVQEFAGWFGPITQALQIEVRNDQSISFPVVEDQTLRMPPPTLNATASSGLAVVYSSQTPAVCTVTASGAVTIVGGGLCTLAANQPGNSSYFPAPQILSSFNVYINSATFVRQTIPSEMNVGQPYTIAVTMKNGGDSTWRSSGGYPHRLGAQSPQDSKRWNATGRAELPNSGFPNTEVTFTFQVTAPSQPGEYEMQWQMVQEFAEWFGAMTDKVVVRVKGSQTITFNQPADAQIGTTPAKLVATATSGLMVAFSTKTPAVCAVSGDTLTLLTTGDCTIAANQAGSTIYQPAPEQMRTFKVTPVSGGTGITSTLNASPNNVRVNGSATVSIILRGVASGLGTEMSRLELFQDSGNGFGGSPINTSYGNANTVDYAYSKTLGAGMYRFKLKATDNDGRWKESSPAVVNVTNSLIKGAITGVQQNTQSVPQLVGWVCETNKTNGLNYQVYLNAPRAFGGTQLTSGVANVSGRSDDATIQSTCGTTGSSHHFVVDLGNYAQFAGSAIYVEAQDTAGKNIVLPCADNNCTMPGTLRIGITTPNDGDRYNYPSNVFVRLQLSNGTGSYDEVAFNVNGEWINATPDQAVGTYYASKSGLPVSANPYTVYGKVRQGNMTLYSMPKQFYVVNGGAVSATIATPQNGGTATAGESLTLGANVVGTTVASVKFIANGVEVGYATNNGNGYWSTSWAPAVPATYSLKVHALDAAGTQLAESAAVSLTVNWAPSDATPKPVMIEPPHQDNPDAGTLPGSLAVSNSGAATYSIPIVVPPGTAGMAPDITLSYASNAGNGPLGVGWSLGGMSSIHRCGRTIAQDGVNGRVSFDKRDRLCLDGQRLLLSNKAMSDDNYWSDDAEYRTEIESFSKITASLVAGNRTFTVKTKDGRILTFGTGTAYVSPIVKTITCGETCAQPQAKSGARAWALARVEDRSGNFIAYDYQQDASTGEHVPLTISYGAKGLAAHASIKFTHEIRNDQWKRYVDETRNDLRKRIVKIETYVGASLVRTYSMKYAYSLTSGRSMLTAIEACAMNRSTPSPVEECLPRTVFKWGQPDPSKTAGFISRGFWANGPSITTSQYYSSGSTEVANHPDYFAFVDMNGDKYDDIIEKRNAPLLGERIDKSNQLAPGTKQTSYGYYRNTGTGFIRHTYRLDNASQFSVSDVADFNGDGAVDLLVNLPSGGVQVCVSPLKPGGTVPDPIVFNCNSGFSTSQIEGEAKAPYLADVFGDGRTAVFSRVRSDGTALVCVRDSCKVISNPPVELLGTVYNDDGTPEYAINAYTSLVQSVDYGGTGKPYNTRWTRARYLEVIYPDPNQAPIGWEKWSNLVPTVSMPALSHPDSEAAAPVAPYKYSGYSEGTPKTRTPYMFDAPPERAGLSADFNGAGYSSLAFGFKQLYYPTDSYYTYDRAEFTVCLSTGRALDCDIRQKYSGSNYRSIAAVGNFVGDGQPGILTRPLQPNSTFLSDKFELCTLRGDATSAGPDDQNIVCTPWNGVSVTSNGTTKTGDQFFFMDLLGTGRMQLVKYHFSTPKWEVFEPIDVAAKGEALDRIVSVTNGLGLQAVVEYADGITEQVVKLSGNSSLSYPRQSMINTGKVVNRLIVGDTAAPERKIRYEYWDDGVDLAGRGSLGFAKVVEEDELAHIVTTRNFSQTWPHVGALLSSKVVSNGVLLSDTVNLPATAPIIPVVGSPVFPYVQKTTVVRKDLGGQPMGTTVTDYADLDNYGNVGRQTTSSWTDEAMKFVTEVVTTYRNEPTQWLLGLPETVTTTRTIPTGTERTLTRSLSRQYYDTGLLKSETIEPGNLTLQLVTSITRNTFGLPWVTSQAWKDPIDGDQSRDVSTLTYDTNGRFVATSKNAVRAEVEVFAHDPATGARTGHSDLNGLTTSWKVNGFGRVLSQTSPDQITTYTSVKQCPTGCPAKAAMVQVVDIKSGTGRITVPQLVYFDAFGRELRRRTWGFHGKRIDTDKSYDTRGRLVEQTHPYYEGTLAIGATRFTYDELNRVIRTETRNEAAGWVTATTDYQGLVTVLTNPRGQKRTEERNAIAQLVKVTDSMQGAVPISAVTSFSYEPFGNLATTTDPNGNVITVKYNLLGHKVELKDPNLGVIAYTPDPLGRVRRSISPNQSKASQSTVLKYDKLDRMVYRLEPDLESTWVYDTAVNGIGKLARAYTGSGGLNDYIREHQYDTLGRLTSTSQQLIDATYFNKTEYDAWSRPVKSTYARGTNSAAAKVFEQRYNANGFLARVERNAQVLMQIANQDASNRVVSAGLGNKLIQARRYNQYTGRLESGDVDTVAGDPRLHEDYFYDSIGNLTTRTQGWDVGEFTESFTYDGLNRLETSTLAGQVQSYTYDLGGNILTKTGVGTGTGKYTYPAVGQARPNAVSQIEGVGSFTYDDNGNQLATPYSSARWTSFDMPLELKKGTVTETFYYGPEHQRTRQDRGADRVVYAGAQEFETKGGQLIIKTYWPLGIGVEIEQGGVTKQYWNHADRLGSIVATSGEDGALVSRQAYDPWGKRRTYNGTTTPNSLDGSPDNRGFTGHEMLDELDLVHMNGRVYDPFVGRFLSADPLIQDPYSGQNYSRYTYVSNNPTNLTDPTGFCEVGDGTSSRICAAMLEKADKAIDNARYEYNKLSDAGQASVRASQPKFFDSNGNFKTNAKIISEWNQETPSPSAIKPTEQSKYDKFSQWAHIGLSGAGAFPGLGIIPDFVDFAYTAVELPFGKSSGTDLALAGGGILATVGPGLLDGPAAAAKIAARMGRFGEGAVEVATTAWKMGPHDLDLRGTGKGMSEALSTAFEKTGLPKSEFSVSKWSKDANGKSFPVEWRHKSGAEVNVDWAHQKNGPAVPHVGFQTGGKRSDNGAVRGHILMDDVPYNR
jgi:RHS repeat-associated protein